MSIENRRPIYVDSDGKKYYEGTPKNPFNAQIIPPEPLAADADIIRADQDIANRNPAETTQFNNKDAELAA